jgi:hypothetical protein
MKFFILIHRNIDNSYSVQLQWHIQDFDGFFYIYWNKIFVICEKYVLTEWKKLLSNSITAELKERDQVPNVFSYAWTGFCK